MINSSEQVADQYKPAPGNPYRPVLSPPEQIYRLQAGWSDCVITHAFAGIDPPRSLTPASALVPNLTPTPSQSHVAETESISSVSGPAEAGFTGTTRDPTPSPAHKVHTAGPRSTPGPSTVKLDPNTSGTSLDPQNSQARKTHSDLNEWHAPSSQEAASETQASSKNSKDLSTQDPFKDRNFISVANTEIQHKALDAFHPSEGTSDQQYGKESALSPNAIMSGSLPTHEEEHEEGASRPFAGTTRSSSVENGYGQTSISIDQNTLASQSKYPKGTTAAEPSSLRPENQLDSGISTENHNPADRTMGDYDGVPGRVTADPPAHPTSTANTARIPNFGSPNEAAQQFSPYNSSLSDQGEQQLDILSPSSKTDGKLTSTTMGALEFLSKAIPDPFLSAPLMVSELVAQTSSSLLTSTTSTASTGVSGVNLDPLIHPPSLTQINTQGSISSSTTPGASAPASIPIASHAYPDMTPDPQLSLSLPSSDSHSVLAEAGTLRAPQSKPSNNIKPIFMNQTTPAFGPGGTSDAGRRARGSSVSKNFGGDSTVVPHKGGGEMSITFSSRNLFAVMVLPLATAYVLPAIVFASG